MITIYIKPNRFAKNVDENGNIFDFKFETIEKEDGKTEIIDVYLENGFTKVELADIYKDCEYKDFNEDLTFNVEKYNARKEKEKAVEYENKIVALIRERYNINQELAILRQKDTKIEEYNEYYAYIEECKAKVKNGLI